MTKLTATLASAAALLLAGNAFAASDSIQVAQASGPTRAEVRQEARENPPASGVGNTRSDKPQAASSTSRAAVRAEARKSKPVSGAQSDMGSSQVNSSGTRAEVRKETAAAVKAGDGPATNAGMSKDPGSK